MMSNYNGAQSDDLKVNNLSRNEDQLPYTFISRDKTSTLYAQVCKCLIRRSWRRLNPNSSRFNIMLGDRNKLPYSRLCDQPGMTVLVNYYRGSSQLCRKVPCVRLLHLQRRQFGLEDYNWLPDSFIITPTNCGDTPTVKKEDDRDSLRKAAVSGSRAIWISKSSSGAKGDGIFLSHDVEEIVNRIDSHTQSHVVQKYIERPLLLPGQRKFDIRCWVVLDSDYQVHFYNEGVARTCSDPYNVENLNDTTGHLSNHCIQEEQSANFGHHEPNNEIFFKDFSRVVTELSCGVKSLERDLLPQIHRIIIDCLEAVRENIHTDGAPYRSFQVFGFDFLIDHQYKVWLLEVNGAPAVSRPLLSEFAEALTQLVIDPMFPPLEPTGCMVSSNFRHLGRPELQANILQSHST